MTNNEHTALNLTPDVLILGGGAAGVAAAVGAAKMGASVVLIEKNGYAGGKATASYVGTVCGMYFTGNNHLPDFAVSGFPREFANRLMILSDTKPEYQKGGLYFIPYERLAFMSLCDEYLSDQNVNVLFHSTFVDVAHQNNVIASVKVTRNQQQLEFYPKTIIDTSGDALVAKHSGIAYYSSENYQAAAHVFTLSGIPDVDSTALSLSIARSITTGTGQDLLPKEYSRLSVVPGTFKNGKALLKLGIPIKITDSTECVTEAEQFSRKAITEIVSFLKTHNELLRNAEISMIAPETGIRTGPRNEGQYMLTETDVLNCVKFDDGVARGTWPVEIWEPGKNVVMRHFENNGYYEIPARCLQSNTLENLYFAGRNISADDDAIASARVIGSCLQTGYAAGILAAGACAQRPVGDSVATIREHLFSHESS